MLRIEHLTKTYGSKKAVDDLTLHIAPGEIYGFIGHNGAGKTTTIKACCGILQFDSGEIAIDGISIKDDPLECKRRLAYIPDSPDLYDFLSGIQYLNFIADIYIIPQNIREERIAKYAEMFALTSDLAQPISAYSHGMKQKLAIISALIHEPKLMLLDEPYAEVADARAVRPRRRNLLLVACPRGRRKAVRQSGDHPQRKAHRRRYDRRGARQCITGGCLPGTGGEVRCCGRYWQPV